MDVREVLSSRGPVAAEAGGRKEGRFSAKTCQSRKPVERQQSETSKDFQRFSNAHENLPSALYILYKHLRLRIETKAESIRESSEGAR